MAVDLNVLKAELLTDPQGYGYAQHINIDPGPPPVNLGSNSLLAEMLNEVRATEPVPRSFIPANEIITAIVPVDWDALTDASDREWVRMILGLGEIPANHPNVLAGFQRIFQGDPTLTALNALRTRDGSRGETLFGEFTVITGTEVREALAIP